MTNVLEMNFKQIESYQALNQQLPIPMVQVVLGAPGSGKTAHAKSVLPRIIATARGINESDVAVIVSRPSLRDSVEFTGVGIPQNSAFPTC